ADELAAAIAGQSDAELSKRPDAKNWAAKEVVSHLRDTEEFFMLRFATIMAIDNPPLAPPDPDRWADERQYLRNDAAEATRAVRLGAVVANEQRHVRRTRDRLRVATEGAAMAVEQRALARERLGPTPDVPVVGVTRGDLERHLLAAAADHQLGMRTLRRLGRE